MKVLQNGKEVKDAQVIYSSYGTIDTVRIKGVHYSPKAFELVDEKEEVRQKGSKETKKTIKKVAKKNK